LQPDLFVVSIFLSLEALLLYYALGVEPVIFTPFLREAGATVAGHCLNSLVNLNGDEVSKIIDFLKDLRVPITSIDAIARPLDSFCEIVACPEELEVAQVPFRNNVHYLGPSVRKTDGHSTGWLPPELREGQKIIYASLGSQSAAYGIAGRSLLEKIVKVMRLPELREMHLLLATGTDYHPPDQEAAPENVTFLEWAPQTEILGIASMAIIHGGLGTVKECIYSGVPMIVVPFKYDQPLNARRVAHHHLGITFSAEEMTEDALLAGIIHVLNDEGIRGGIDSMRQVFRRKEELSIGADVIGKCLDRKRK
jgi:MGT family glycosyltransferase